jgi:hypothetical protein
MDDDHLRRLRDLRDRCEVLHRVVGKLRVETRIRGEAVGHQDEGVAIGSRFREQLGSHDRVRARPIVDDDALAHLLAELLADDAKERVVAAARGIRGDEPNGFYGILLSVSRGEKRASEEQQRRRKARSCGQCRHRSPFEL